MAVAKQVVWLLICMLFTPPAFSDFYPYSCMPNPCLNGGSYSCGCSCPPNYTGERCEVALCVPECKNNGVCCNGACFCPPTFTGDSCESEICDPSCQNGGVCVGGICLCLPQYTGENCESDLVRPVCQPECQNGGTCVGGFCVCSPLYTGEACQSEIQDVGLCDPRCQNGGYCDDGRCQCSPAYAGVNCTEGIDPCEGPVWNCDDKNPCTPENMRRGYTRWLYEGDCSKYVWCLQESTKPIECSVWSCPDPLVWNPYENTCTLESEEYNCYCDDDASEGHPGAA